MSAALETNLLNGRVIIPKSYNQCGGYCVVQLTTITSAYCTLTGTTYLLLPTSFGVLHHYQGKRSSLFEQLRARLNTIFDVQSNFRVVITFKFRLVLRCNNWMS